MQAQYYKCRTPGCQVTGKIDRNDPHTFKFGRITEFHNHPPVTDEIAIKKAKVKLKQQVKLPNVPIKKVYQQALAELPVELREDFGSYKQFKSVLHAVAVRNLPKCKNLRDLAAILGPNTVEHQTRANYGLIDGQPFFRQHFQDGPDDAVLFLNPSAVTGPRSALPDDPMFVDGTFRTRPSFKQQPLAQVLIIIRLTNNAVS